jgi:hypothetical protein
MKLFGVVATFDAAFELLPWADFFHAEVLKPRFSMVERSQSLQNLSSECESCGSFAEFCLYV